MSEPITSIPSANILLSSLRSVGYTPETAIADTGLIREWGVSNFDTSDMHELSRLKHSGNCAVVQDLYHVGSRGVEYSLLPYLRKNNIAFMAYCPLAMNGTLRQGIWANAVLQKIAAAHNATVQQIMIAWAIRDGNTIAIPKSSAKEHTLENAEAASIELTEDELRMIENEFPAPDREMPLDVE